MKLDYICYSCGYTRTYEYDKGVIPNKICPKCSEEMQINGCNKK